MKCNDFQEIIDSYLCDELLTETNHDVLRHLEQCRDCRQVIEHRREFRGKLRSAVTNSREFQIDKSFDANLRNTLRENLVPKKQASRSFWTINAAWAGAAASLLLVFSFGIWFFQTSRNISTSTDIVSLTPQVQASFVEDIALGDHLGCAVNHSLEEKPVEIDMNSPQFINLKEGALQPLQNVPREFELVEAHSCKYQNREFTHLIFETDGRMLSVIMLDLESQKDSLKNEEIVRFKTNKYQMARFDVNEKAVFVISDLDEQKNSKAAEKLLLPMRRNFSNEDQTAVISDVVRWY